ncbi:MAG: sigma 54-interacting transcriptional regulator [Archangium sp.]
MSTDVLRYLRPVAEAATGREAELAMLLREHHEAKTTGTARFVFVRGPRGVGKSHLLSQLAQALASQGVPVFEGGSAREVRQTWGVFAPMVGELLTLVKRSGVPETTIARLARALEPVRAQGNSVAAEERRLALYDGAGELFSLAGRAAPLVLWPDLDVADRASLELIRYLAAMASTPQSKVGGLFVLTFREDEGLPQPLSEIVTHVSGRSLSLSGLDLDGIRGFLARGDVAQRLLEVTGGNPEALGELLERPVSAVDFFVRRVERLSELQRATLTVLSLAPEALPVEWLAAAMGSEGPRCAETLDGLLRERLVTVKVVDGRPSWRFARETEKQAFAALVPTEQHRVTTLAIGRVLAQHGQLVSAAELLLPLAPVEGAKLAISAADALVERGALEDAEALYARSVSLLERDAQGAVLQAWGRVLALLGDYRGAVRRLLGAAARDASARSKLALEAARLLIKAGRGRATQALLKIASADASTAAAAEACLAEVHVTRGRAAEAAELARAALARGTSDEATISLRQTLGKALLISGQVADAQKLFAENADAAQKQGDVRMVAMARLNEGVAAFKRGDRDRAIACWEATPPESRPLHAHAEANLGSLYAESGDFELALGHLTRALSAFSRFGSPREVAQASSNLSRLHHLLGDVERATELSEHALRLAQRLGDGYLTASAQLNLGALAVDGRDLPQARRQLETARSGFENLGNDAWAALAAAWKARAHLLGGERAQAELELSRKSVERGAAALQSASLEVELTRGELCLANGDLLGAGRAASRAREALLDRPELEGPIRTYFLMGKLRLAANDSAGAQAEFQRAGRLLDELVQRVPPVRRTAFLSLPRRAEVVAAVEPELRLPRAMASLVARQQVESFNGLVGRSPALQRITRQLEPVGRSNATVLIRGESGTGKELLADALHALSPRRHMPLVKVNCAAMVEELLLSELFGHEKGAFTGAIRERKGRFELADGGTIFLDEIGDISPKAQVALLRVLQEREFERVGGSKTIKVDVRIICATNRDLEALITQGRFRADLYYRLKGVMLELPALRERLEDLPSLTQHFLDRVAKERNEPARRLSPDSMALLSRHRWPGNIRELENVISSASIFAEGPEIEIEAFGHVGELRALIDGAPVVAPVVEAPLSSVAVSPSVAVAPSAVAAAPALDGPLDYYELARRRGISLKDLRHEVEMQCIKRALEDAGGNISEAARLLKMKRSRLSQIVNGEVELKEVAHGDE